MNQIFATAFFMVLYLSDVSAQQFFTPGYLVTVQGDTLQGEIKEKGNKTISLRMDSKALIQSYTPAQVTSYMTENINHVAASLSEDGNTNRFFLRERIKGYVSLYSLNNSEGELTYVLQLPDRSFLPLRGKQSWSVLNRNLTECSNPMFLARLEPQRYIYNYTYFEKIIVDYNRCIKPDKPIRLIKSSFHYEAGVLVGVARNRWNYSFVTPNPYFNPNGLYPVYNTFAAGGFITIMPQKRLSLTLEALYTQYKGGQASTVTSPVDPTIRDYRYYSFQEQFLTLPIIARYVFLNRPIRCYVKGGLGFTYDFTLKGQVSGNNLVASDISMRPGLSFSYILGLGADLPLPAKHRLYTEIRIMPHVIKDGSTHIGNFRSTQLVLSIPLLGH